MWSMVRGKFIAIEGPDGSGKTLQQELLVDKLSQNGYKVAKVDFPQYETSLFGEEVGKILSNKYGPLDKIHPKILSVVYAADRWKASSYIRDCINNGEVVVANRYTLSNMAHQSARLPQEEREEFLKFLERLEYHNDGFGIPRPDLYIHLSVPTQVSQELILKKAQRNYLEGGKKDQLEADVEHQIEAARMYESLAERYDEILSINCCDDFGNLYHPNIIHEAIFTKTRELLDSENIEGKIRGERE